VADSSVVIVGAKRTAIGSLLGQFTGVPATQLGATAIKAALEHAGVAPDQVQEVLMGCVLPAGLGQAPARQAALGAGVPAAAGCTTVSKVCGSGMKAIMLAHDAIVAGSANVVVAGGMESMTNAPHLLPNSRTGSKYGPIEMIDHMAWDGLTNPYDKQAMGVFGEQCVAKYSFTREEQDAFASESVRRAVAAQQGGAFADEIAPVVVSGRKGDVTIASDEEPARCDLGKVATLKPAFKKDGTITAATSSKISDGAAATVLMSAAEAKRLGARPLARIVAHSTQAQAPEWFTTAPVGAIQKVLDKAGWKVSDVDLFEVNEAFACVAMAPVRELGIPHEKLNVHGGATALGHPIGASGARLVVTLIHALRKRGGKRGVASLCIGGGEATAIALELV
jgi:acetyl-CoA C-acetyltransferase